MQLMLTGGSTLLPFQPVVDGALLPRHPMDEIRDGLSKDVRVLVGTTRDEWKLFGFMDPQVRQLDEEKIALRLQKSLPHADGAKIAAGYRAQRPAADWASIWLAIETDRIFRIPSIRMAEAQLTHRPDVYSYLFTWESPGFGGLLGACHAIEIPFVFSCLDLPGGENFVGKGPDADRLAQLTMDAWLAFAKSGDPSHADLGAWAALRREAPRDDGTRPAMWRHRRPRQRRARAVGRRDLADCEGFATRRSCLPKLAPVNRRISVLERSRGLLHVLGCLILPLAHPVASRARSPREALEVVEDEEALHAAVRRTRLK